MTGAMYAAVSGLKAHMSALNVIGNNVSNVNTLGYKATRYTFNEALYTSSRSGSNGTDTVGGRNPAQIGYGCSIGTIDLDMSTKNYTPTGRALDTMIDGDGFFIVGDKTGLGITKQDQLQGMNLTRLGNFEFDSQGYLVDGNGSVVYGFLRMTSADEVMEAQRNGDIDTNFESADDVPESMLTSPILTPIRFPMCVVTMNEANNAETTVVWPTQSEDGNLIMDATTVPTDDNTGGGTDTTTTTASLTRLQPDTVSIDEKSGAITAVTKDGLQVVVGYLALAKVDNPNGVTHVDGRYYQALGGAGNVHLTSVGGSIQYVPTAADNTTNPPATPDPDTTTDTWRFAGNSELNVESAGGTNLVSGGLESSGTDLATEVSNMVMIQRGYQANTRIVTVTDSMLEELVNMKR